MTGTHLLHQLLSWRNHKQFSADKAHVPDIISTFLFFEQVQHSHHSDTTTQNCSHDVMKPNQVRGHRMSKSEDSGPVTTNENIF